MDFFLAFSESLAVNPSEATLPIVFDPIVEDSNLTNFTRSDANCDKTGTCYDGKGFFRRIFTFSSSEAGGFLS